MWLSLRDETTAIHNRQLTIDIKKSMVYSLWSIVLAIFFSGCASFGSYNPATDRRELILISTDAEIQMGKDVHAQILKQYKLSDNVKEQKRLNAIGQRVAQVSDRQDYTYNFYLLNDKALNAFTTPGGNIYFFTGLMDKLSTDDEIASVLAHEVGHCAAKHTVKKYQAALGYNLLGSLILGQVAPGAQRIASLSSGVVMNLVFSAYSRKDEYQADKLGLKYTREAGYDPKAFIEVLQILKKEEGTSKEGVLFLRSHPYFEDRIKVIKEELARSQ